MSLLSNIPSPTPKYPRRVSTSAEPNRVRPEVEAESQQKAYHYKPVLIVVLLLIPCLLLTAYYARYGITVATNPDSLLPNPSYAVVMFFVYLDSVGLVVLTLLLSRNLIRAYFEKRHRLIGSGFRAKLIAAFIGFSSFPPLCWQRWRAG